MGAPGCTDSRRGQNLLAPRCIIALKCIAFEIHRACIHYNEPEQFCTATPLPAKDTKLRDPVRLKGGAYFVIPL